jgi:hypothetical protein
VALALCLSGLALLPGDARAFCRTTTKTPLTGNACVTDGIPLRWERQCLTFSVEEPVGLEVTFEDVRDVADRSFQTWGEVTCDGVPIGLSIRQTEQAAQCAMYQYNSDAPNMNSILFLEDWEGHELPLDAFAVTLVWNIKDTGEIVDADMLLNPSLGKLTICGNACLDGDNDIDLQNVITHEAGHFLGLAHSDVAESTMSSTAPVGEVEKRDLTEDDRLGLCEVYGALPTPAACAMRDYVPRHGFSPYCAEPRSDEGCSVGARSIARRERRFGGLLALGLGALALLQRRRRAR